MSEEIQKEEKVVAKPSRRSFVVRVVLAIVSLAIVGLAYALKILNFGPIGQPKVEYGPPPHLLNNPPLPKPEYGPPPVRPDK